MKDSRAIRLAVTSGESRAEEAFLRRYSTEEFILSLVSPPAPEADEPFGSFDRGRRDLAPIEDGSSYSPSENSSRRCLESSLEVEMRCRWPEVSRSSSS